MVAILRTGALFAAVGLAAAGATGLDGIPGGGSSQTDAGLMASVNMVPVLTAVGHMGDWDWGWVVMMPMMLIFWGGLIWLIVWLVRRPDGTASNRDNDPVEIARRRYARGEITSEELEQIRRNLTA